MASRILTLALLFSSVSSIKTQMSDKEILGKFEQILCDGNYSDLNVPPTIDGQPLEVTAENFVLDISNVDEISNAFTVDMLLLITWEDWRFNIVDDPEKVQTLTLDLEYEKKLWRPYLILLNAVLSEKSSLSNVNVLTKGHDDFYFSTNGKFKVKKRIIDAFRCKMDLRNLPFDTQICTVDILSSAPEQQMSFKWSENAWMIKADLLRLNKFTLVKTEHENVNVSDRTKHGYQITLKLTLKREYGYYIYQGFIPSVMVVCVSWIIFWVSMSNGEKVALEVMLLLTMTTLASFLQSNLPQVSYLKFLDIWFFLCTTFVFMTLMQIVFQHLIVTRKKANFVKDFKNGPWIEPDNGNEFGKAGTNSEHKFKFWCKIMFPCLFALSGVILFSASL